MDIAFDRVATVNYSAAEYSSLLASEWTTPMTQLSAAVPEDYAREWLLWPVLMLVFFVSFAIFLCSHYLEEDKEGRFTMTSISKRDRRVIGRLVLPKTAVREKKRCEGGYAVRLYETWTRQVCGNNWNDYELMIGDGMWAADFNPLLVFVNVSSGGRQGLELLEQLETVFHRLQIVNLAEEGPEAALHWWSSNVKMKYRILVCGGDGTVGWVVNALETLKLHPESTTGGEECYMPPVSILPLGTGNDLERTLGWGCVFQGGNVIPKLKQVAEARVTLLDRWTVVYRDLVRPRKGWRRNDASGDDSNSSKALKRRPSRCSTTSVLD
jgi:hypothetical protein